MLDSEFKKLNIQDCDQNHVDKISAAQQQLLACVKKGELDKLKIFLEELKISGLTLDQITKLNTTEYNNALHLAILAGMTEIAFCLIENGHELSIKSPSGRAALHIAAENNRLAIAQRLIKNGVNCNIVCNKDHSALYYAIQSGYFEMAKLLIQSKASLDTGFGAFKTALSFTIANLSSDTTGNLVHFIKYLIDVSDNINAAGFDGLPPLLQVIRSCPKLAYKNTNNSFEDQLYEILEYLLYKKADVTVQDNLGNTPMTFAIRTTNCTLKVIQCLIEYGADIDAYSRNDSELRTPLMYAIEFNEIKIAEYLIDKGAKAKSPCKLGSTAVHAAIKADNLDILDYLIKKDKSNLNVHTDCDVPPLYYALKENKFDIAKWLILKGADINTKRIGSFHNTYQQWFEDSDNSNEILEIFNLYISAVPILTFKKHCLKTQAICNEPPISRYFDWNFTNHLGFNAFKSRLSLMPATAGQKNPMHQLPREILGKILMYANPYASTKMIEDMCNTHINIKNAVKKNKEIINLKEKEKEKEKDSNRKNCSIS